ncbi:MAG TPA: metallophosphoesterase [Agromyces sp.]
MPQPRGLAIAAVVSCLVLSACAGPPSGGDAPESSGPEAASDLRFTASGDFSATPEAGAVLRQVDELDATLHLALGDLSYGEPGEEQEWCEFVTDRVGADLPFQLVAGNHESDGSNGHIDAFAECLPNRLPGLVGEYARQYYVDVPAEAPLARFVMISPGIAFDDGPWSYEEGTERYEWTRRAIEGARDEGVPWVVVGMHKPCLTVGNYACDPGPDIVDLLVSSGVDLVLSGHEHLYQRSVQLGLGDDCASIAPDAISGACIVDAGSELEQGRGTVFVTVGTGGRELRDVHTDDPEAPYFAAWSGANAEPAYGNLEVRLSESTLDARFVAAVGSFDDRFRLTAPG